MSNPQFNKTGIINVPNLEIDSLYSGKQYNLSNMVITYDHTTDVFKPYGFDTCTKIEPIANPSYYNSETKTFMAYSYLVNPTIVYELGQEYVVSLYAYVSTDCNADMRLHLEHANAYTSNYLGGTGAYIVDSTKGKVVWVWGRCKASTSDGKIYIMFYPNPNQANVFTQGYQLFAGITVYKGSEVVRPMNNNVSGSGLVECVASLPKISKNLIMTNQFYEN